MTNGDDDNPAGNMDSSMKLPTWPSKMPAEVLVLILRHLSPGEIKSFLLVSRTIAAITSPWLLERDIKDKTYNSLAWACYFGDVTLAERCLEVGASPNVAFCHDKPTTYRGSWIEGKKFDREYFENPVFPTRIVYGWPLLKGHAACSPLTLATNFNHIDVMRVLLDAKPEPANVIDNRIEDQICREHPRLLSFPTFSHPVVLSHAQSASAAQLLFDNGAIDHINNKGNTHWGGGPLIAAIDTRSASVVKLVLHSGSLSFDDPNGEFADAFMLAMGSEKIIKEADEKWLDLSVKFSTQLLDVFFSAGISPNEPILNFGQPLSLAVAEDLTWSTRLLVSRGADINYTDPYTLCPLAQALVSWPWDFITDRHLEEDLIDLVDCSLFTELFWLGADPNQPSFSPQGFSPLMFATSDKIPALAFEILIEFGADRGYIGQLTPDSPRLSVLQCLLLGFPQPSCGQEMGLFVNQKLYPLNYPFDGIFQTSRCVKVVEKCRKAKFEAFIEQPLDSVHFYTEDGMHILNWALEELRGFDLIWAIDMLIPQYASTKSPMDTESPLVTFFIPLRLGGSLEFGTLFQTCRFVERILKLGFRPSESLLRRICNLSGDLCAEIHWNEVVHTRYSEMLDFAPSFLQVVKSTIPRFNRKSKVTGTLLTFQDLTACEESYCAHRSKTIGKIISLFIKSGADFYACDSDGKTAYECAKINNTLNEVPEKWRNAAKEREIDEANA
ncbi:hypothetical protein G7Z17_g6211 [Cylindrodendrum hubeiense]|uniref:F-box domain-containing protein n=1 Tax=Cylindrodendrum hubeiense TaxID=595255 RepID=A0A9P5HDN6_9HYPO|nr:hypothetical protein G7Z17_g6211 [Cylindrodendrum hubeiense]